VLLLYILWIGPGQSRSERGGGGGSHNKIRGWADHNRTCTALSSPPSSLRVSRRRTGRGLSISIAKCHARQGGFVLIGEARHCRGRHTQTKQVQRKKKGRGGGLSRIVEGKGRVFFSPVHHSGESWKHTHAHGARKKERKKERDVRPNPHRFLFSFPSSGSRFTFFRLPSLFLFCSSVCHRSSIHFVLHTKPPCMEQPSPHSLIMPTERARRQMGRAPSLLAHEPLGSVSDLLDLVSIVIYKR
jgi:hypothetical protein